MLPPDEIGWIAEGKVPEYKQFTNEPKAKRNKRHKKYGKEALEIDAAKKDMETKNACNGSLEQQIMKRQADREAASNNFFDRLLEKYGGSDDSEDYEIPAKKMKKKKATTTKTPTKATQKATTKATIKTPSKSSPKTAINKVKNGRVAKTKK